MQTLLAALCLICGLDGARAFTPSAGWTPRSAAVGRSATASMLLPDDVTMLLSEKTREAITDAEKQQFYINAFVGGPIALIGGNFFRIINGSEKDGFETDPVVKFLGGPEKVRAAKARIREEGMVAMFDPRLFL